MMYEIKVGDPVREKHATSLMAIIKTLVRNIDSSQREEEKRNLEKKYKDSCTTLDRLLHNKQDDLYKVVHVYSKVSEHMRSCRERIVQIKESLHSCKELLYCKRDALRNLYVVHVEQTKIVELLDKLEANKDAPERIQACISRRHYLRAARLLTNAQHQVGRELSGVGSLQGVSTELTVKQGVLADSCFQELRNQLYSVPATVVLSRLSRTDSFRDGNFSRSGSSRQRGRMLAAAAAAAAASVNGPVASSVLEDDDVELSHWMRVNLSQTSEEVDDNMVDRSVRLLTLIESLWLLGKLPWAVDRLRREMGSELRSISARSSAEIATQAGLRGQIMPLSARRHPGLLCELLDILLLLLTAVSNAHRLLIRKVDALKQSFPDQLGSEPHLEGYEPAAVWGRVQEELELLLNEYLDEGGGATGIATGEELLEPGALDLSLFFGRRSKQLPPGLRLGKKELFTFGNSSHALSVILRESSGKDAASGAAGDGSAVTLVCQPSRSNITAIYNRLEVFLGQVEAVDAAHGACQLRLYLENFVRSMFLPKEEARMRSTVMQATKDLHGLRTCVDERTAKDLGLSRPILESACCLSRCLRETESWLSAFPSHLADGVLKIGFQLLSEYIESLQRGFRLLARLDGTSQRLVSAQWALDDDILRLHKNMPHWQRMRTTGQRNKMQKNALTNGDTDGVVEDEENELELSAEEQVTMWSKEAYSLLQNMRQERLNEHDMAAAGGTITGVDGLSHLRLVAHLHESAEWLSDQVKQFTVNAANALGEDLPSSTGGSRTASNAAETTGILVASLTSSDSGEGGESATGVHAQQVSSRAYLERMRASAAELQRLADTCLLLLHLESRVVCYVRISQVATQGNYLCRVDDIELDERVSTFLADISAMENALSAALQAHKFRYVVEGLGHLAATILMDSLPDIKRMNDNGVKKMSRNLYALQQSLSALTHLHETDLVRAKELFELLHQSPDSVLNAVRNHGAKFSQTRYLALFDLYRRSRTAVDPGKAKEWRNKLQEILNITVV